MNTSFNSVSSKTNHPAVPILTAGLIAGTMDITAAIITNGWRGVSAIRVLQSVASGLLGAPSFRGGNKTAAIGLGLHFVIAMGAAVVYYLASRKIKLLLEKPFLAGPIYGIAVFLFMNLVVLPLSAIPFKVSTVPSVIVTGLIVHIICIGLPIALAVSRFSKASRS